MVVYIMYGVQNSSDRVVLRQEGPYPLQPVLKRFMRNCCKTFRTQIDIAIKSDKIRRVCAEGQISSTAKESLPIRNDWRFSTR